MQDIGFWDSMFLWRDAVIACSIAAVLLSYLGVYVVLMRSAFVSAAVSQLAGLGVVVALVVTAAGGPNISPIALGVGLGVLGSGFFALSGRSQRMTTDAALALAVVGASAFTLVLARFLTLDYQHVQSALYGDAVVAEASELWMLGGTALLVLGSHAWLRYRFLLVAFDSDAARAQGMRTDLHRLLLGLGIGLSISVATRALGALPAFAFTVAPASAALLLTSRLRVAFGLAVGFGLSASVLGYYLSFMNDLPTGPTLVAVALLPLLPGGALALTRRLR